MKVHVDDELFERRNFAEQPLPKGEYTQCRFVQCTFAKADLIGVVFVECAFEGCDLSLAKVRQAAFREVRFTDCKLLGVSFDQCNGFLFAIMPERCNMASASFRGMRLGKAVFRDCSLKGADLSAADLSGSVFDACDLLDAVFDHTDLSKADLRTAHGFTIDPEANKLVGARFSSSGLGGLLAKYRLVIEQG
ncbi:MAG: pentapeptide repeat-containing protein [Flavobacteriales bacterium]